MKVLFLILLSPTVKSGKILLMHGSRPNAALLPPAVSNIVEAVKLE
jgi:hypothetical protein